MSKKDNKKYLLPALTDMPEINSEEGWRQIDNPYKFLLKYLKLYYEPTESIFEGGSNATPHIYEQMLLFHKIFLDKEHPEHRRAVLEWRVVLMILALQRIRNLKVDMKRVELSSESSNLFLRAATMMVPEDPIGFYNTTWDFIYLIMLEEEPIALVSPVTLICPAKQMMRRLRSIEWLSIEKVNGIEMLLTPDLTAREYGKVYGWLEYLRGNIIPYQVGNESKDTGVMKEIFEFMKVCEERGDLSEKDLMDNYIYSEINGSNRKEFDFLNYCCKFIVNNPKIDFLVQWYQNDIFLKRLPVILYNSAPDAMKKNNVEKLDKLFQHTFLIHNMPVIQVKDQNGLKVAALILLPFTDKFADTLIRNRITPEELFENISVVYDRNKKIMELSIKFKEFPYIFSKKFSEDVWSKIYADQIASVFLWPWKRMESEEWKRYYVFSLHKGMRVSVPSCHEILRELNLNDQVVLRLIQTEYFPMYLKYTLDSAIGYLPIQVESYQLEKEGGFFSVYVDVGHSTTCIRFLKNGTEWIQFQIPGALRVSGVEDDRLGYHFIPEEGSNMTCNWFRNMIHSLDSAENAAKAKIVPFKDGSVLFHHENYSQLSQWKGIRFFHFEYESMDASYREMAHVMIEEILLLAVYHAVLCKCSYIQLNFLHSYPDNDTRLGELKGLWNNAFNWVKEWTGIKRIVPKPIQEMREYEALAYAVYGELINEEKKKIDKISNDLTYIGVDIGWKKTEAVFMTSDESSKHFRVKYEEIQYAGHCISAIDNANGFMEYPSLLNILLNGAYDLTMSSAKEILDEFGKFCSGNPKISKEYAEGLFDLVAIQIEKENFKVPSDIYNNMPEFRLFIKMLTYNILLLFLNIGYLVKKTETKRKKIRIYLSGNGAKFLRWISNDKGYRVINETNDKEVWIPKLNSSVLDIVKGFLSQQDEIDVSIKIVEKEKEWLINGFAIKNNPELEGLTTGNPEFDFDKVTNELNTDDISIWDEKADDLFRDIFDQDSIARVLSSGSDGGNNITERLKVASDSVGKNVIEAIQSINK